MGVMLAIHDLSLVAALKATEGGEAGDFHEQGVPL